MEPVLTEPKSEADRACPAGVAEGGQASSKPTDEELVRECLEPRKVRLPDCGDEHVSDCRDRLELGCGRQPASEPGGDRSEPGGDRNEPMGTDAIGVDRRLLLGALTGEPNAVDLPLGLQRPADVTPPLPLISDADPTFARTMTGEPGLGLKGFGSEAAMGSRRTLGCIVAIAAMTMCAGERRTLDGQAKGEP